MHTEKWLDSRIQKKSRGYTSGIKSQLALVCYHFSLKEVAGARRRHCQTEV